MPTAAPAYRPCRADEVPDVAALKRGDERAFRSRLTHQRLTHQPGSPACLPPNSQDPNALGLHVRWRGGIMRAWHSIARPALAAARLRRMPPLITLTTDFGTRDGYVAAMKGVMLARCPTARFVDVTHAVSPQDVMEAAFVLQTARPYIPAGAVHLVVVDPGVGTGRRAVALRHADHLFVGPDNGVFPLVLDGAAPDALVTLDVPAAWRTPEPSTTFHGRDIFAPVAAHLAAGRALADVGSPLDALKPLRWARPMIDEQGIQGWIVHIDRFGNAISNIPKATLEQHRPADASIKCVVGSTILSAIHATYGRVAEGEPLLLFGSTGYLEVGVNGGNAAELLDIRKGDRVNLVFQ